MLSTKPKARTLVSHSHAGVCEWRLSERSFSRKRAFIWRHRSWSLNYSNFQKATVLYLHRFCPQVACRQLIDWNEAASLRDQCEIIHALLVIHSQSFGLEMSESHCAFMMFHDARKITWRKTRWSFAASKETVKQVWSEQTCTMWPKVCGQPCPAFKQPLSFPHRHIPMSLSRSSASHHKIPFSICRRHLSAS